MKKALIIAILTLLPLSKLMAQAGQATLDSVKTTVSGLSSITTLYVTCTQANSYQLKFWIMGVKHTDGTYSSYSIQINGQPQAGDIVTTKGDWQLLSPTGQSTFPLAAGSNQIQLVGTLDDIPNVEHLFAYAPPTPINYFNLPTIYEQEKTHSHFYPNTSTPIPLQQVNYNKEFVYSVNTSDSLYPSCLFTAHLAKRSYYTFLRQEYYTAGQHLSFQTDKLGNVNHVLHVFSKSNPGDYSWSASTTQGDANHANLSVNISQSGFYYVLIRAYNADTWGTCNLRINSDRLFEDIPFNNYRTDVQVADTDKEYACFALGKGADPIIFLMDGIGVGHVLSYADNYTGESSMNWSKNARFDGHLSNGMWVLTSQRAYDYNRSIAPTIDTYTSCEKYTPSQSDFPHLKRNDALISGAATGLYNCISWALGEWTIGYWLADLSSQYGNGHHIQTLDSLFNVYHLTRSGATEANAVVDLWGVTDANSGEYDCKHASVKAKCQEFASGFDWESKLGSDIRIFHPRTDLRNGYYGELIAHYRRFHSEPPIGPLNDMRTILNITLTPDETTTIEDGVSMIPKEEQAMFYSLYGRCQTEGMPKAPIFLEELDKTDQYVHLYGYCIKHPRVVSLVYQKVNQGDVMAVKLLHDLTKGEYQPLWDEVVAELRGKKLDYEGRPLVHSIVAEGKLFLKSLLGKELVQKAFDSGKSFSSDECFKLSREGEANYITFCLSAPSVVSLMMANIHNLEVKNIIYNRVLDEGTHKIQIPRLQPGVSTFCLVVNGNVYEKKVSL